jgi:hypothetical protein
MLLALAPLVAVTACTASKSSNPLSPEIAGPIPGVEISAPKTLEPIASFQIPVDQQPVTLLAENAGSNGVRPLSYVFEVSADSAFSNVVYRRDGVPPGDGGRTSVRLADRLAPDHSYFWRVRAQDGANVGPFSPTATFDIYTPIVINPPDLQTPGVNEVNVGLRPTFTVRNATHSGPVGPLRYLFELSDSASFANKVFQDVPEGSGSTSIPMPSDLSYSTVYYWHARAFDAKTIGPWSETRGFQTMAQPVEAPPPPVIGGGNWEACGSTPGPEISKCVHDAINPPHTVAGAFEVVKRVAWLLRGGGGGLLLKPGGENIVTWNGKSYSASRMCYPDGHIYKLLSDVPTTNGASWQDDGFVDRSLYVPAIDPR